MRSAAHLACASGLPRATQRPHLWLAQAKVLWPRDGRLWWGRQVSAPRNELADPVVDAPEHLCVQLGLVRVEWGHRHRHTWQLLASCSHPSSMPKKPCSCAFKHAGCWMQAGGTVKRQPRASQADLGPAGGGRLAPQGGVCAVQGGQLIAGQRPVGAPLAHDLALVGAQGVQVLAGPAQTALARQQTPSRETWS